MKAIITIPLALFSAIGFSSCATQTHAQHKGLQGAAVGAGIGAIIGKQSGETGRGAALGGILGGVIGHTIGNNQDKQIEANSTHTPTNQRSQKYDPYSRY